MLIAMNKFTINKGFEDAFEQRWRDRKSLLDQSPGYMHFRLLKQALQKTETCEFISYTEWLSEKYFLAWTESQEIKRAHSSGAPMAQGMMAGPPEFRAYQVVLDQGYGHRTDFRSPHMDHLVEGLFAKEEPHQKAIFDENNRLGLLPINIGRFEGQLIEVLLRAITPKFGIEIGTLGGYSTTWLAKALVPNGKLITIEIDPKHAEIARGHFAKHGLSDKIEVRQGAALEVLEQLNDVRDLDFVFIDADKGNYGAYTRWALPRLKKGGLLIADNAYIWGGMNYFGKPEDEIENTRTGHLDSFSKLDFAGMSDCWNQMASHPEFASIVLPTGEGLGVAIKK